MMTLVSGSSPPRAQWSWTVAILCMTLQGLNCLKNEAAISVLGGDVELLSNFHRELASEDLEVLAKRMDEQVKLFQERLLKLNVAQRWRRDIGSPFTVELEKENLEFDISNGRELPAMAHFLWNDKRFCILGNRIYSITDGKIEPFLSGLPIEDGDIALAHVFEEAIFIAVINKNSGLLRLYLLKSPGWTLMVPIQRIASKRIEDCEFFESDGTLHMALAVQSETSEGMELVIFTWSGNTMDTIQSAEVKDLRDIAIIHADQIHIVLLHANSSIQLWRFEEDNDLQLIDKDEVEVPRVLQLDTFYSNGKWYILLGGNEKSYLLLKQDERLVTWQVLQHNSTTSEISWTQVYHESGYDNRDFLTLIFHPLNAQGLFEVFQSDSSGVFARSFTTSAATFHGFFTFAFAIAKDAETVIIYAVSANNESDFGIEAISLRMNSDLRRPSTEPLLECLSDVEGLVMQLQLASKEQALEMKNNLVHYKDDVNSEMTVTVNKVSSALPSYNRIEVLTDHNEAHPMPRDVEASILTLKDKLAEASIGMDELLTSDLASFTGQLKILGSATVESMSVNSLNTDTLNSKNWKAFNEQAWRYSQSELTLTRNAFIEQLSAGNVTIYSSVGGSSPTNWLLKTGGRVSGKIRLPSLTVEENVNLGNNRLNGVKLNEVVDAKSAVSVTGEKSFHSITVDNYANISHINNRDFASWADATITHSDDTPIKISGTVRVEGLLNVSEMASASSINDVDIYEFSVGVVNKNFNNAINGQLIFSEALQVNSAIIESLNGVHIDEVLSTSADQVIKAKVKGVETIEAVGNIVCDDINGINFDDFVYAKENVLQDVLSPIHFSKPVVASSLEIVGGTLNGLNVSEVFNPREIWIQSSVEIGGNVSADEANITVVNGLILKDLNKIYWTKSTEQVVNAKIYMPTEVTVDGEITVQTFLGKSLTKDFLLTTSNQTLLTNVTFNGDVTLLQNAEVGNLANVSGVSLQALDEEVVKKTGVFNVFGIKVVDELRVDGELRIEETFNDLRIPEDILLLNKPQKLNGITFINDAHSTSDVFSHSGDITLHKIAGILLNDFLKSATLIDEDATLLGLTNFKEHVDVGKVEVKKTLNDVVVQDIFSNGIKLSQLNDLMLPSLTLFGNVVFNGSIQAIALNGYNVDENFRDVVNTSEPGIISGVKKANAVISNDLSIVSFNDLPVDFSNLLTATTDQTLSGDYLLKEITAGNIDVQAINGRNLSEFVKTSRTGEIQLVLGPAQMEHLTVKAPLKIENRILNQCSVTEYLDLTEFKQFDNLRIENGSLIMETPFEANPLLAKIATMTVRKDKAQEVNGAVAFNADIEVKSLIVPNNIMGVVDLRVLFNESMLKTGFQEVLGLVFYTDEVRITTIDHVQNLEIDQWNGADVQETIDDVALMGFVVNVTANKSFLGDLKVLNQLDVKGNLNDVKPSNLIKLTEMDEIPSIIFTSLLITNITVDTGIIDGVNLKDVILNRIPLVGDASITSNFTFTDVVNVDFATFEIVNSLHINEIVLKTSAPGQTISGQKILTRNLAITGDISVSILNGLNPDEVGAYVVLKDRDATFEHPMVFNNGATVLQQVCAEIYEGQNMTAVLTSVPIVSRENETLSDSARTFLTKLQQAHNYFADFQFFEQIQQVSLGFPTGSYTSAYLQHCQLRTRRQSSLSETATGLLIATHSIDGNSCGLSKLCRCHRSAVLPLDASGRLNTLRTPKRLKEFLEIKMRHGDRVRLLSSPNHLFIFTIEALPGCQSEKVTITVLHSATFETSTQNTLELDYVVLDITSEIDNEGIVYFAIMKNSGVDIYSFDSYFFTYRQTISTAKPVALALVTDSRKIFLAVATHGLEAVSSVWTMEDGNGFVELKEVATVGATDVIFTKADGKLFLTLAQDPSNIAPYTDNWSQLKVPAQVYLLSKATNTFDLVQQLDIDRVVSLANLNINGEPFIAAASSNGEVRIYRLVPGQGFQAEQTFKIPGVKSIVGYMLQNETYLATTTDFITAVHVARLRGLQKPSIII